MGCVFSVCQRFQDLQLGLQDGDVGAGGTSSSGQGSGSGHWMPFQPWNNPFDVSEVTGKVEEPDPSDTETIRIEGVDFLVSENATSHRTDEYDVTQGSSPVLVVRRGQPFNIRVLLSRAYDRQLDDLRLVFETGSNPKRAKGTHVEFVFSDKDRPAEWGARLTQATDRFIVVKVFTPPECLVGRWSVKVDVVKRQDDKVRLFRYSHPDHFYLLFNPWCKEDPVFQHSDPERLEYVLNDKGKIYVGSKKRISARPWVFGQFTGHVLECCVDLLDNDHSSHKLPVEERGNPISVVRRLTALVNSSDEGGVLMGNWSGNYSEGTSPLTWTGSEPILDQYHQTKKSVKFGQCWVFSGLMTTVCRALGMPARSVTNFSSAHDVDASTTIDVVKDPEGNVIEKHDSVWNFHVWNEVWMARTDLPHGYGGWQAADATPQERSSGVYCCGPCPVRAIKAGEVNLNYDGRFIFAEVNADRITWVRREDGSYKKVRVDKKGVGKSISAKSMSGSREDLTLEYKHPEGSSSERVAVRRAQQLSSSFYSDYLDDDLGPNDVDFKLHYDSDNVFVGDNFTLQLDCRNDSRGQQRTVTGTVLVKTMFYTGVEADDVLKHRFTDLHINPQDSERLEVEVTESAYLGKLRDMCMLSFTIMATVQETGQIFTITDDARLRKPHLQTQGPTSARVGEEFEVEVTFTNPLSVPLTNCYLELEAPGMTKATKHPQSDVGAKDEFRFKVKLTGSKQGPREVVLMFNSKQLEDVNGTHTLHLTPA